MRAGCCLLALTGALCMQAGPACGAPLRGAAERLVTEIGQRSQAMTNLEELCDGIGPRMTGSPQLRTAQAWAMNKLRSYGAVNVHEEAYDLGRPWQRGSAHARLLNAGGQAIPIVQKAWTEGTGGAVRGDVALLDVKTLDELRAAAPGLRGKVVLVVAAPKPNPAQASDPVRFIAEVNQIMRNARVAAVLLVAHHDANLFGMWGGTVSRFDRHTGIITRQSAGLLKRLLAKGVAPRIELALGGGFAPAPVQAYNVVADFPGSEAPDEIVILGAHQDAWDVSPGATDNGAGTVVALEVMRAMHAQGLRPRRTLRVVLFSGEEQGHLGSKAYVARHRGELAQIQAVLVQDAGSGRIEAFPDMKVEAWRAGLVAALAPLQKVAPLELVYTVIEGSDHDVFFAHGIPAFAAIQDPLDYRTHTQDSELDTIEHVARADLVQGAQVMAVAAWGMLNGERLPHQPALVKKP